LGLPALVSGSAAAGGSRCESVTLPRSMMAMARLGKVKVRSALMQLRWPLPGAVKSSIARPARGS
jgi:hypothetical protein